MPVGWLLDLCEAANKALDDLQKVMADGDGHVLVGGNADPRKDSAPCGWSLADFDALGDDSRALAAKGLYLSSFIGYGAEDRGTVKESTIRDLYVRSVVKQRFKNWTLPRLLPARMLDAVVAKQLGFIKP